MLKYYIGLQVVCCAVWAINVFGTDSECLGPSPDCKGGKLR